MQSIYEKFKKEKKVVSIYNDYTDTGNCWSGFVIDVDDDYILLAHITEHGFSDGFTLMLTDEIINVEEGTAYEKKIQKLYELRKQRHDKLVLNNNVNLLEGILEYAKDKKEFITITMSENDEYPITGIVEYVEDDNICIKSFTSYAKENGYAYIRKLGRYQVHIASLDEQNYALLYND